MLGCESKGSGHWRERTCVHPHFLFTFSLCYYSTEKPQLLQKEKLPVSFWKFSAQLLLRTQVAAVVTGLCDVMGGKKYFLTKRNKFKPVGTQHSCLSWVLLHVRQGDWCGLHLKTKSPTDEADVRVLQFSVHWHFEYPYECLLCQHPIKDCIPVHKSNACRYENRYGYK